MKPGGSPERAGNAQNRQKGLFFGGFGEIFNFKRLLVFFNECQTLNVTLSHCLLTIRKSRQSGYIIRISRSCSRRRSYHRIV